MDGKIRFSQNAKQAEFGNFSYTNYDTYGRPVESGEYLFAAGRIVFGSAAMTTILENTGPGGGLGSFVIRMKSSHQILYDVPDNNSFTYETGLSTSDYPQTFVNGGVSRTKNPNNITWYSYDEQGKLRWMVQKITRMQVYQQPPVVKIVEYDYDLFGNVNTVIYQRGQPDAFYHHYTYDAIKRLTKVETSKDGATKILQATYSYYLHGPLKRVTLGTTDPKNPTTTPPLQGMDYVYTAQGQLKSINHLDAYSDPGGDANDLFAEQMEYFPNDYKRTGTGINTYNIGNLSRPKKSLQFDL